MFPPSWSAWRVWLPSRRLAASVESQSKTSALAALQGGQSQGRPRMPTPMSAWHSGARRMVSTPSDSSTWRSPF